MDLLRRWIAAGATYEPHWAYVPPPNATLDDRVATAFHRNTLTNNEGGTIDEEFRTVAVIDRVNTTMSTWMGTTMACAQCHDHKYDRLSQREYFQLYAVLNNTADADRTDEAPVVRIPWAEVDARRAAIEREIAEIEAGIPELKTPVAKDRPEPPEFQPARKIVADLRKRRADTPAATVPVLEELAGDRRRITKIQLRGNWQNLGDEVRAGVSEVFNDPRVAEGRRVDRRALAKWLVDPGNPLTARVIVNRLWERLSAEVIRDQALAAAAAGQGEANDRDPSRGIAAASRHVRQ